VPAALTAALLVGTAAAFVYTESLKLEPAPLRTVRVTKLFSPVCKCNMSKARIAFSVRQGDVVSVSIEDAGGNEVRRLAARPVRPGPVAFLWNGRDAAGEVVRDGVYHPRVRLELLEKEIELQNEIRVDSRPPRVSVASATPRVISPDGDGRSERVAVVYVSNEPAQAILRVGGIRRVLGKGYRRRGQLEWFGRVDGRPVRAGTYSLAVVATDLAGNRSRPADGGVVRVRYVELAPDAYRTSPGAVLRVGVSTDARRVSWLLAGRTGTGRPPVLRLRAPAEPGEYRLFVTANGHGAVARVVVAAE
jgi:flagellar hook capping protein FlgD